MSSVFSDSGVFTQPGKQGQKTARALLKCTVSKVSNKMAIIVTGAKGELSLNHAAEQDFEGTPYITVFGKSLSNLSLTCMEMTQNCSGSSKTSGNLASLVNALKQAKSKSTLPTVTISYSNGSMVIKGILTDISFTFDPPHQYFTLDILGTFE